MEMPYLNIDYKDGLKVSLETVKVDGQKEELKGFVDLMDSTIKDLEKLSIRSTPEGYETTIEINGYEFDAVIQYLLIPFEAGEKGDFGMLASPNIPAHIEVQGVKLKEGQFWSEYDLPEECLTDILEEILEAHIG